jgi:hypothetical protein
MSAFQRFSSLEWSRNPLLSTLNSQTINHPRSLPREMDRTISLGLSLTSPGYFTGLLHWAAFDLVISPFD